MATLVQTLLSRVNALTTVVNSIISKALKIDGLQVAATPLNSTDLVMVSQNGVAGKTPISELGGVITSGGKIIYGSFQIFGHQGDASSSLVAGNIVQGWFSSTEFWLAARYNGGDVGLKASYTILSSIEDI